VPLVEQELLTLPEHLSSTSVFSWVRVTRPLVLCVMFYRSLFFLLYFFFCLLFFLSFDLHILIALWYLQTLLNFVNHAFLCMFQARTWMSSIICFGLFFVFSEISWEVTVRFFLYWWNCWPSLFKLTFRSSVILLLPLFIIIMHNIFTEFPLKNL
jgi:hypothetical protein